jgi:hypothetical protein
MKNIALRKLCKVSGLPDFAFSPVSADGDRRIAAVTLIALGAGGLEFKSPRPDRGLL